MASTARRHQRSDDVDLRAFLAWPQATSFVTLVSAACLLSGAWGVLAPTLGDPDQVGSRLGVVGVLAAYIASLLGVVWVLCRWEAANPDAIGASVVGSAFTVGIGVTLDVIARDRPLATALLALGGFAAALAAWRRWNRITGGVTPGGLRSPLALLFGCSFLWPALMGWRATVGNGDAVDPMLVWLPGWWLMITAGALPLIALARGAEPWADPSRPMLARSAMRWLQLLIVLVACGCHQYVLGYSANLDFVVSDFLPLVALLLLLGNELRAAAVAGDPWRDAGAIVLSSALVAVVVASGGANDTESANRGHDGMRIVVALALSPEATLALLALAAAALWRRTHRIGLLAGATAAGIALVLVWGAAGGRGLNGVAALAASALACSLWSLWARHPRLALVAALALEGACIGAPATMVQLRAHGLSPLFVLMSLGSATVLVTGASWVWLVARPIMRIAAWALTLAVLHCCAREGSLLHAPVTAGIALTLCLLGLAWRRRDAALVAPLSVPGALSLPRLMPDNKAWLGVWAAFLLLAGALGIGWRRVRTRALQTPAAG
jgi:hypothetical protein